MIFYILYFVLGILSTQAERDSFHPGHTHKALDNRLLIPVSVLTMKIKVKMTLTLT